MSRCHVDASLCVHHDGSCFTLPVICASPRSMLRSLDAIQTISRTEGLLGLYKVFAELNMDGTMSDSR